MSLASGESCANGYQITEAFLHPQKTSRAFQLSEKQLQCFADLRRPGDPAKNIGAETTLPPFVQEPAARTELIVVTAGEPPLRIYKNEYDQPPVTLYPKRRKCVNRQLPVSVPETMDIARKRERMDQARTHHFGPLPVSPSTGKNAPLSKDDQPSADKKGP